MKTFSLLATLSHLLTVAASTSLRINIPPSNILQNPNTLPASTHATLTSGTGPISRAILRKGNYIQFDNIPTTGSHLLSIYSHNHEFAPYRIDISPAHAITLCAETYPGIQWSDHGVNYALSPVSSLTINAKCLKQKDFYQTREGFNVLSLLKNPMILMGIVALAFTFGMPKLMENMDPEMKAEYEEMQKKGPMNNAMKAMQGQGAGADGFDLAGFLAGRSAASTGSGAREGGEGIRERKK